MWPSSRPERRPARRGFTLLEAMVSLFLLVIVLLVAMTMLFQMRAFAERQQFFMLPRQTARRAAEYLGYYLAGASDLNYVDAAHRSPNAIVTYYNLAGNLTQASYNNLTGGEAGNGPLPASGQRPAGVSTQFGDLGTDVLTLMAPNNPGRFPVAAPFPPLGGGAPMYIGYRFGCGASPYDDAANRAAFAAATGWDGTTSPLLMFSDNTGRWVYGRITALQTDGLCADLANLRNIHVTVETASGTLPAPPNGAPVGGLADPVFMMAGLQPLSFRVLTDDVDGLPKLQQKLGLFDPGSDNPGTAFVNVMENVEDLQVAYMYQDGSIWNVHQDLAPGDRTIASGVPGCGIAACNNHVPPQAGPAFGGAPEALDVTAVVGIRLSITGRSPLLTLAAQKLTNVGSKETLAATSSEHFRPDSEDHPVTIISGKPAYDLFDHYRATTTMMLRNRIPRG